MQEADRALYFLTSLAPFAGQWLLTLPTSLSLLRTAAANFISFAALPTTSPSTHLSCPPCSPAEKVPLQSPDSVLQWSFVHLPAAIRSLADNICMCMLTALIFKRLSECIWDQDLCNTGLEGCAFVLE